MIITFNIYDLFQAAFTAYLDGRTTLDFEQLELMGGLPFDYEIDSLTDSITFYIDGED